MHGVGAIHRRMSHSKKDHNILTGFMASLVGVNLCARKDMEEKQDPRTRKLRGTELQSKGG
jgi:hypothetical protein